MACLSCVEDAHGCAQCETSDSRFLFECLSPRVSFSKDFVEIGSDPQDSNEGFRMEERDSTSEFEFSISNLDDDINADSRFMLPADQLFLKGKLLPLQMPHVQRLDSCQLQEKGNGEDMMCISIGTQRADVVSSVSGLIFSSSVSGTDPSPLSPKSTKCSGILTELLSLKKSSVHGHKYDRLRKSRHNPEEVSLNKRPTKSLHLVFKLPDIKASFSRSTSTRVTEPLLSSSYVTKPTIANSSPTLSSTSPPSPNFYSETVNPECPHTHVQQSSTRSTRINSGNSGKCFLMKSFSANARMTDQTKPVIYSSTDLTSHVEHLAHSNAIVNRQNGNANFPARRNPSLGTSNSKEPSPWHRHNRIFTSGIGSDINMDGFCNSLQPRTEPRYLQRSSSCCSSSNSKNFQRKHAQLRNVGRRVERFNSYSYSSSLRVSPLLKMPVFIVSAVGSGKTWKKGTFRISHLFAWKKEKQSK